MDSRTLLWSGKLIYFTGSVAVSVPCLFAARKNISRWEYRILPRRNVWYYPRSAVRADARGRILSVETLLANSFASSSIFRGEAFCSRIEPSLFQWVKKTCLNTRATHPMKLLAKNIYGICSMQFTYTWPDRMSRIALPILPQLHHRMHLQLRRTSLPQALAD